MEADALYLSGRHREAAARARETQSPFGERFAAALDALPEGSAPRRVELTDDPHIRQHHATCAPASLAQVAHFHGDPVDHLELAETICYEGTPSHRQRAWAEARGYVVREWDLTLESARALIDRRLPFVLVTAWTSAAHAQVVVGYDEARRGLLVRDPGRWALVEMDADALLEDQAWNGPRAMVLAPYARAAQLQGVVLPGAELYDVRHRLALALEAHDVGAADTAVRELEAQAPGSLHALAGALSVARYREDVEAQRALLDRMLELHPETPAWVLRRGGLERGRRPQRERLADWERIAHLDDPTFLAAYAEELRFDGARHDDAVRLLSRALRLMPVSGPAHHILADLLAPRGDGAQALESYRLAVTCEPMNEHFARAYADHARRLSRDDEALALLEARVRRAGARSSAPARTLFEVHFDRGNPERGLAVLEALWHARPHDGELATMLVHASIDSGDVARARRWLDAAPVDHAPDRALAELRLLRSEGRLAEALGAAERGLAVAPERIDLIAHRADLLAERDGPAAAIEALAEAHARAAGDGAPLRELCVRLRGVDDERARALLAERVAAHPDDMWSRRELARSMRALGRLDEAALVAREAVLALPFDAAAHAVLGSVLDARGDHKEARAALRRSVELEVDSEHAILQLATRACDPEVRRDDARFVLDRLEAEVSGGPGIIAAVRLAAALPPDERNDRLARLLERAPDRPDAWEAVARTRMESGHLDGALETVQRARERFPRWATLGLLMADVLTLRGDLSGAERELHALIAQAPAWAEARVALGMLMDRQGRAAEGLRIVEDGLVRAPRSTSLAVERAFLLHSSGDPRAAFDAMLAALRESPEDPRPFDAVALWARELGRTDEVERVLREQAARSRTGTAFLRLGTLLVAPERRTDRIAALREAVARAPRNVEAIDALAQTLALCGDAQGALAMCPPEGWRGPVPIALRGRRAWARAESGDRPGAIEELRSLLREEPGYAWGRSLLCEWLEAAERYDELAQCAALLVEHSPTRAASHVYLGDARLRLSDRRGARDAFERASELDPTDAYAAERMIELYLADGCVSVARERLDRLRRTLTPHDAGRLHVQVALAAEQPREALAALDTVIDSDASGVALEPAVAMLARSRYAELALTHIEARLARPDRPAPIALGWAWARAREAHPPEGASRLLALRDRLGAAGRAAVAGWIESLAIRREQWSLLWLALWNWSWLRAGDETWAAIGFALDRLGLARTCAWWMRDWRERTSARPTQLVPLLFTLWDLDRRADAQALCRHAGSLARDHASLLWDAYTALEHALAGRIAPASELLLRPAGPDIASQAVQALARAVIAAHRVPAIDDAQVVYAAVWSHLEQAGKALSGAPELAKPYDAAVLAIVAARPPEQRDALRYRIARIP